MPSDSITISLWVYIEETQGGNTFMLMPDNSSNRVAGSFFFAHNGKSTHFADYGGISKRIFYEPDTAIKTWTFMLITRSSSELSLFKNGGILQTVNNPGNYTNGATDLRIGAGADGSFHGSIDDFRIYNRVLNAAEIDALSIAGSAGIRSFNKPKSTINVNIYSNPFIGEFYLDMPQTDMLNLSIYNNLGQAVNYIETDGNYSLTTDNKGIYYVVIESPQGIVSKKLIKN